MEYSNELLFEEIVILLLDCFHNDNNIFFPLNISIHHLRIDTTI